jgi:hypothetical protein
LNLYEETKLLKKLLRSQQREGTLENLNQIALDAAYSWNNKV